LLPFFPNWLLAVTPCMTLAVSDRNKVASHSCRLQPEGLWVSIRRISLISHSLQITLLL